MQELIIKVGGMSCQGCVSSVSKALAAQDGVERVEVSLEAGEARVSYDPARVQPAALLARLEQAGYEAMV